MSRILATLVLAAACLAVSAAHGATFYYTGMNGGDFFTESNWNSMADGTGVAPDPDTINPSVGFVHDLIIDGKNVNAVGPEDSASAGFIVLDIGALGSLSVLTGSDLQVTNNSFNAQFEVSTGATFTLANSTLGVDDDVFLRGTNLLTGGSIESFADDVEFVSSNVTISGTSFAAADTIIFRATLTPAAGASITGATFTSADRIGIREFDVTATDSTFVVTGDVEDVFGTNLATSTLTLLGASTLTADQIQEGVKLRLGGTSQATFTNLADDDEPSWITETSTVTIDSADAKLILPNPQTGSAAASIFNGVTGQAYSADPNTWSPNSWNGTDAATLMITSVALADDADFDGNDVVDGNDVLIWQRGLGLTGQTDNSTGDANGDHKVDFADLEIWAAAFGSGSSLSAVAVVPEPSAAAAALTAIGCSLGVMRKRFVAR